MGGDRWEAGRIQQGGREDTYRRLRGYIWEAGRTQMGGW
jgi:hypothetical protein